MFTLGDVFTFLALVGAIAGIWVRFEHRMTRVETKLDYIINGEVARPHGNQGIVQGKRRTKRSSNGKAKT